MGEQGKDPGVLSAVSTFFGIAQVVVGLVGAVVSDKPDVRLGCSLVLFLLWLLVVAFDLWGWGLRWDTGVPALFATAGMGVLLVAALDKFAKWGPGVPEWLVLAAPFCLAGWCFHEIFSNLTKDRERTPQFRFRDSQFSIAVAVALLIGTPLWFVIVWQGAANTGPVVAPNPAGE